MIISANEKGSASPILLLVSLFFILVGLGMLVAPLVRLVMTGDKQAPYLYAVAGPFALLLFWISSATLSSWLNITFSSTEIQLEAGDLNVRNWPFGKSFNLPAAEIRSAQVTDILKPSICLEILLVDQQHKTYQVCAFRTRTEKIEEAFTLIREVQSMQFST